MKVFISQPMRGKTDAEILKERKIVIAKIKRKYADAEIIDSFIKDEVDVKNKPLWCLGRSIQMLSDADIAVFMHGWQNARGCCAEQNACIDYNVPIDWDITKAF